MVTQVPTYAIPRTKVVQAIMEIRHEWETAARGDSLLEITASVGYLLFDIARALELKDNELQLALGDILEDVREAIHH